MHTKTRYAPIDLIVIHDPEGANTARELYNYLQTISAGYHALEDDNEEIIAADDNLVVEGAGGVNSRSLNVCIVPGRAAWTREQWLTHLPAIKRMAARIAVWCKKWSIPPVHLIPSQVGTVGVKGICTHGDVTLAGYTASEGHTDPGPNFPMDVLLAAVNAILQPPAPKEVEDVIVIPCPNKPTTDPNKQPHVVFMPPSQVFPNGGVVGRHGAEIKGSVRQSNGDHWWTPKPIAGHKWVSMMSKMGRYDEDPTKPGVQARPDLLLSRGIILVDDHGETTTVDQGLWI